MYQYRLLRDNKESGPYSVSDLQAMGLKPFDLIWQEGKSAAWRYPGEIDELMSFAPPVEEQPFDRFYRKPDAAKPQNKYAPQASVVPASTTQIQKGHIVVTMPSSLATERTEPRQVRPEPVYQRQVQMREEPVKQETYFPANDISNSTVSSPPSRTAGKSIIPIVAGISILLIGSIIVLVINNNIQNKKITQLRDIVTQMQQTQSPQNESEISQPVVHYPVDQQSAGLLPGNDSISGNATLPNELKSDTQVRVNKISKKASNILLPPKPPIDSLLVKEIKFEKPTIEQTGGTRVSIKRDETDNNLMQLVKVNTNDYKTGLLGGINNLKLTLFNKSLITLKKVEVQIDYLGPEKRVVKTQTVFFENVGPGEDLLLDVPKSNRGVKVNCIVKKINT